MSTLTGTIEMTASGRRQTPVRCVGCGQRDAELRVVVPADPEQRPFDLVRCPDCGLVQQCPRYTPEQLKALYRDDYYVFAEAEAHRWARAAQQYVMHVAPLEPALGRRLLDLGCALGHFSALADRRGWRVTGLDLSAEAVSQAAGRFGLDFRAGSVARFRETLPPFDVAFLGDVIEHVPEPLALLRELRRALAPNGVITIDTPNWGSRWRKIGRRHWLGLNRYHINLFDAGSLTRLLTASGFTDIRTAAYTHYRYESWCSRPEMQAILAKLPNFLAWRINRYLERRSGRGTWAILRGNPPQSLEDADRLASDLATPGGSLPAESPAADNLIATARRN